MPWDLAAHWTRAQPHSRREQDTGHTTSQEHHGGGFGRDWNIQCPSHHRGPHQSQAHTRAGRLRERALPMPTSDIQPGRPGGTVPSGKTGPCTAGEASILAFSLHTQCFTADKGSLCGATCTPGKPQCPQHTLQFGKSCLETELHTKLGVWCQGDLALHQSSQHPLLELQDKLALNERKSSFQGKNVATGEIVSNGAGPSF